MHAWSGTDGGDIMGPSVGGTARQSAKVNTPPLKNGTDLRESGYLIAVGSRTARFRRRHMHRFRNIAIVLLLLILIIAVTLLVLFVKNKQHKSPRLCTSKECLRSAANLAISMDTSVDPCDDFHQYVCGNWASEHPRPDRYSSFDWFRDKQSKVYALVRDMLAKNGTDDPKPVQQAKDLYASCLDTANIERRGLKPIYDILESVNLPRYPIHINATADLDLSTFTFDWLETVIKIKTTLGMDVLIGFDIFTDPKNSAVYRLVMGSPETTNPFPSFYREKPRHTYRYILSLFKPNLPLTSKLPKYKSQGSFILNQEDYDYKKRNQKKSDETEHVYTMFYGELIKIFAMESGKLNESKIDEVEFDHSILSSASEYYMLSNDVYELETGNSTDTDDNMDFDIPEYGIDEIQSLTDKYVESNNGTTQPIWKRYLEGIFNVSTVTLDFEHDKVLVSPLDMKYMEMMALLVSQTHPAVLELYIWVKVVEVLALHTTKELRLLYYRSYEHRSKHRSDTYFPPRSLQCASAVNDMFGMAVAYAIVEPNFFDTTRPKVLTMIDLIKDALASLVGQVKWMDDNTKLATYRKIINMNTFVGFPKWLFEPGKLEEHYEGIEVSIDTYLENMVNIVQAKMKKGLNRLHIPYYYSWPTDPTEVNAYHTFQENTITVPMVMLQYPFFDLGLDSLNYGSLGTVLGHEITHGFDNYGRQFDRSGNFVPWWTNDTVNHYVNMTHCFIDQYSSYYVPELDKHVNGNKTLGENIADNGGLREAFLALKYHQRRHGREPKLPGFEHMTAEQMFFLSYANLWCGVSTEDSLEADLDDEHSPPQFRARGTLQNSEDFSRTWNCSPGSPMNPNRKKCIIF